jgi:hypothetical protein
MTCFAPWSPRLLLVPPVALALLSAAGSAAAYSTDSIVSDPCHELATTRAIRAARAEMAALGPLPARSGDDEALLDDLPFELDEDLRELGAAALILGNRHVDLQGNEPDDLDQLAQIHGNPQKQDEHCLRSPEQDGEAGSEQAIAACREFIVSRVLDAQAGLDASGAPDPNNRVEAKVFLEFRGAVDATLPRFWFRMGEALHALQDSFSHTYRTADHQSVVTVLNYIELVDDTLDESEDGPAHSSPLDRCKDIDDFRRERFATATAASAELLRAAADDATMDPPLGNVEMVLDRYLGVCGAANDYCGFGAPCDASNGWCGAREADYVEESKCVCSAPGRRGSSGSPALLLGALALGAVWRARRRKLAAGAIAGAAALGATTQSFAQDSVETTPPAAEDPTLTAPPADTTPPAETAPPPDAPSAPAEPVTTQTTVATTADPLAPERAADERQDDDVFPFGVSLTGSLAVENAAFAGALGLRYRVSSNFLAGVDGEYNPWFSWRSGDVRPGSVNVFATGILRFPLSLQRVNLRSTLELGVSRIMFALYGVPEGSVGPYIGFNLLGLDIELTRSLYLIVNPAHIAIPIPQVEGVPFAYPQYRFTLGFQFGA